MALVAEAVARRRRRRGREGSENPRAEKSPAR